MHLTADDHPHSIKAYLGAFLFYLGLIISLAIHCSLIIIIGPFFPFKQRFFFSTRWPLFMLWWLKITCGITCRIIGNMPTQLPVIILSKHQSQWETFYLQVPFQPQVTVLKRSLLFIPIFGLATKLMRPIAIDRSQKRSALQQIITQGAQRLKEGNNILLFPEGTRIRPGQNSKLSRGGFILAKESGFPIVPIAHNAGEFWHPDYFTKKPGEITLVIGEPIETQSRSIEELMEAVRNWMQTTMYEISALERQAQSTIELPENK